MQLHWYLFPIGYVVGLMIWTFVAYVFFGWYEGSKDEPPFILASVFWPVTTALALTFGPLVALGLGYKQFVLYSKRKYIAFRKRAEWSKKNAQALAANNVRPRGL
jgi:hypothetical protein